MVPWYSPPFLTRHGGYKLCIRVDANGWGDGAGTHVSVHVFFMEGSDYVRMSKSDFYCNVTIKLVQCDHQRILYFGGYIDRRVNRLGGSNDGKVNLDCSITKFISHSFVESSKLCNDYLTWRVTNIDTKYY